MGWLRGQARDNTVVTPSPGAAPASAPGGDSNALATSCWRPVRSRTAGACFVSRIRVAVKTHQVLNTPRSLKRPIDIARWAAQDEGERLPRVRSACRACLARYRALGRANPIEARHASLDVRSIACCPRCTAPGGLRNVFRVCSCSPGCCAIRALGSLLSGHSHLD
jgi:hypothetical protein